MSEEEEQEQDGEEDEEEQSGGNGMTSSRSTSTVVQRSLPAATAQTQSSAPDDWTGDNEGGNAYSRNTGTTGVSALFSCFKMFYVVQ